MKPFRFLFFLYYYPPAPGTAPKRNYLISSEISKQVSFSHIITASIQQEETISSSTSIEYVAAKDYRSILRKRTTDGALPEHKKDRKDIQLVVKLLNTYPINLLIGEGGAGYFLKLFRRGKEVIKEKDITHIYSSFRPFTDHYAAYRLKRKYPRLIWIADFRDLMIDPHYNHVLFPGIQSGLLKRIFRKADVLTTVSEGLATRLKEYNKNVIVLRNGIAKIPDSIPEVRSKYFRIAYTGSMFLDKRNATPIFLALRELINTGKIEKDNIKVLYAGKDGKLWSAAAAKFNLDSILEDQGIIPSAKASEIQRNASINVLLTVSSDQLQGVLTGKMIEYIEAGSPVLGIVVGQNDPELDSILKEVEIGKSFSDQEYDQSAIKDFILQEYIYWKQTGFNRKPVNLIVLNKKFSVEETMRPLWLELEKIN